MRTAYLSRERYLERESIVEEAEPRLLGGDANHLESLGIRNLYSISKTKTSAARRPMTRPTFLHVGSWSASPPHQQPLSVHEEAMQPHVSCFIVIIIVSAQASSTLNLLNI